MTTMEALSYLSFGVGIFGIIIAFYQGFERKKLKRYFHSQSWHIYALANISSGSMQMSLKIYKEACQNNLNPAVLETLSKSEAFNISLFLESIRLIFLTEPKFDLGAISSWAMQGKISKEHMSHFISMMPMESPSFISIVWQSLTLRIKQKFIKSVSPHQNKENSQENSNNV